MKALVALWVVGMLAVTISSESRAQVPSEDPLSPQAGWRGFVVGAAVPPPVGPASPLIAILASPLDTAHPEFAGANITTSRTSTPMGRGGTSVVSAAAAPLNGVGIVGIWPGARILHIPLTENDISCPARVKGIARAVRMGAAVIALPYGGTLKCVAEAEAILRAVKAKVIVVAAGPMNTSLGPYEYPAALPHVLTAGVVGPDSLPPSFARSSRAIDVSGPGSRVLTAVPVSTDRDLDPDGNSDGYGLVSGTAVPSAIVAASVAWIRAARPDLTPDQVVQVIRSGARDVGASGRDSSTGHGVLSLEGALAAPVPHIDPLEPNDDIRMIDGRLFGRADKPISRGRPTLLTGSIDRIEDPADAYRVKLPPGRRLRVRSTPSSGDPDLYLVSDATRRVLDNRHLLARSRRSGGRADAVTFVNRARRSLVVYCVVRFSRTKQPDELGASYVLELSWR